MGIALSTAILGVKCEDFDKLLSTKTVFNGSRFVMNSLTSRIRSKTSVAIGLYLLVCASLGLFAQAQMNAMRLIQTGRPAISSR